MVIFCKKASLLALLSLKTIKNGVKFCVYLIFTFKCNYDKITVVNHKFQNIKRRMVMKKFLAVVSLMLVALMVIAIPAVSAAEETLDKPEGITIYYATDVSDNTPSIDGTISDGEYGPAYRIEAPKALKNSDWGSTWEEEGNYDETLASEYMDVYFAYDDEYIYFAFYELGADLVDNGDEFDTNDVPFRNNYRFQFGFELDNAQNWIQTEGYSTASHWNKLDVFASGTKIAQSDVTMADLVPSMITVKQDAASGSYIGFGDFFSNGNINNPKSQWSLVVEYQFEKEAVIDAWNTFYATEYNELSNAMWVGLTTNAFRAKTDDLETTDNQYFKWLGQNDISEQTGEYEDYGISESSSRDNLFDLVVFGTEEDDLILADPFPPETTEAPTTEEPTTEPATEAPATEAPATEAATTDAPATETPATEEASTEAPATEAPTTEAPKTEAPTTEAPAEEESGCGSTIGVAGLALVAALGTCTVFVSKKRD